MIEGNLNTTNVLLGIMAAVSVLQAIAIAAAAIVGYRLYRQATAAIREIEERRIAPLVTRAQALMITAERILGDVKDVTGRVTRQTERVDAAIDSTVHRVDETTERVRASVASRLHRAAALLQGVAYAVKSVFNGGRARDAA